mgnify:CR=1 FL=1
MLKNIIVLVVVGVIAYCGYGYFNQSDDNTGAEGLPPLEGEVAE